MAKYLNNTGLKHLTEWISSKLAEKLSLNGGTLTGAFAVKSASPIVFLRDTDVDTAADEPVSANQYNGVNIQDKNNVTMGRIYHAARTDKTSQAYLEAVKLGDTSKTAAVGVIYPGDGTAPYGYAPAAALNCPSNAIATAGFVKNNAPVKYANIIGGDYNTLTTIGIHEMQGTADSPTSNTPDGNHANNNYYVTVIRHSSTYLTQIAVSVRGDKSIWIRSLANSVWNEWTRINPGQTAAIGTSSTAQALKPGCTKAMIEFWKNAVASSAGSNSTTIYDSVLVTGLSGSMTAVNGKSISSGPDHAFVYSISTAGAVTPTGNFSKWRITWFN